MLQPDLVHVFQPHFVLGRLLHGRGEHGAEVWDAGRQRDLVGRDGDLEPALAVLDQEVDVAEAPLPPELAHALFFSEHHRRLGRMWWAGSKYPMAWGRGSRAGGPDAECKIEELPSYTGMFATLK